MRNKKHIQAEIIKLRKVLNLNSVSPETKDKVWIAMLALQWCHSTGLHGFSVSDICGIHSFNVGKVSKR